MSHVDPRHGAKQPEIFSADRAERLDDPAREAWLPTERLVALLDLRADAYALDFGTGTGRYALALAAAHPRTRVCAFDVQPEMIAIVEERVAQRGLANVVTQTGNAGELPAHAYDRVLAVNVLHEIGDVDLAELRARVAPGGWALIVDWDGTRERPVGPPPDHVHTPEEAGQRLRHAGFTRIDALDVPQFPYHFVLRASG
ncbi:MAG: class I SAM-dependent methyltransferase [Vulcanimicrobiaceae bacterium]